MKYVHGTGYLQTFFDACLFAKQPSSEFLAAVTVFVYIGKITCGSVENSKSFYYFPHAPFDVAFGIQKILRKHPALISDAELAFEQPPSTSRLAYYQQRLRFATSFKYRQKKCEHHADEFMTNVLLRLKKKKKKRIGTTGNTVGGQRVVRYGRSERLQRMQYLGVDEKLKSLDFLSPKASKAELAWLVQQWVGPRGVYDRIQKHHRSGGKVRLGSFAGTVNRAILKYMDQYALRSPSVPPGTNTVGIKALYRGLKISKTVLDNILKTGVIDDPGYLSFSTKREVAEQFGSVILKLLIHTIPPKTPWIWFRDDPHIKNKTRVLVYDQVFSGWEEPLNFFELGILPQGKTLAPEHQVLMPPRKLYIVSKKKMMKKTPSSTTSELELTVKL